jgi:hypothetical protein
MCSLVYYNSLDQDPSIFYMIREIEFTKKDRVGYNCVRSILYLYLTILQDLFNDYFLGCLDYGPLDPNH